MNGNFPRCSVCKRDAKLYRPYGEFFRAERLMCKRHIPAKQKGWFVPLLEASEFTAWGYTSSPASAISRWNAMPDVPISLPLLGAWLVLFVALTATCFGT